MLPFGKKLGRLCEFEQYTVNVCETILCEIVDESSCFGYTRTCSSDIADQEACHAAGFLSSVVEAAEHFYRHGLEHPVHRQA